MSISVDEIRSRTRTRRKASMVATPHDTIELATPTAADALGPDAPAEVLFKQARLLDAQTRLAEQDLRRRRQQMADERLGMGLKALAGAAGLIAAGLFGWTAWNAAHDRSLVVEAFTTPPDLAAQGLTGRALAAEMYQRIGEMDRSVDAVRAPGPDDWNGRMRIETPGSDLSMDGLDRWLRRSLGRQTRISGELFRTPAGLALGVRSGAGAGRTVVQQGADFDGLLARAAEAAYGAAQPYRFAVWLERHGRTTEALAVARALTHGPRGERPWAWSELAVLDAAAGDYRSAVQAGNRAVALAPELAVGYAGRSVAEQALGWDETALRDAEATLNLLRKKRPDIAEDARDASTPNWRARIAASRGDWAGAAAQWAVVVDGPDFRDMTAAAPTLRAYALAMNHDVAGSRRLIGAMPPSWDEVLDQSAASGNVPALVWAQRTAVDDWSGVLADLARGEARMAASGEAGRQFLQRWIRPQQAIALARLYRYDDAEAAAGQTPADCYLCLRARARVAAARGDWVGAERLFAEAIRQAPSLPAAWLERGDTLAAKGDLVGAAAAYKTAHELAPRFADPLERWGELLMRQGDFRGAVKKFREADRYAPRWGRNRLRWGEALARLGKAKEARKQFRAAAGMDLSPTDRATVSRLLA